MNAISDPVFSPMQTARALPAQPNGPRQAATPATPPSPAGRGGLNAAPAPISMPMPPPVPAPAPAVPTPASQADAIAESKRRMEESYEYQLIRKMLVKSSDDADGKPAPRTTSTEPAQSAPQAAPAVAPAALAQGEFNSAFSLQTESTAFAQAEVVVDRGGETRTRVTGMAQQLNVTRFSLQMNAAAPPPQNAPQQADPLVLDLGGNGVTTTGVDRGVIFDITGDGRKEQVSFVTGDSWFLALDRNNNGIIDDGRELFGDQNGAANGFEELRRFDENGDGVINSQDSVFERLRLFQMDGNGVQTLRDLGSAGISAIRLDYRDTQQKLNDYDTIAQIGQFERKDGNAGLAVDVLLGYRDLA